MVETPAAVSHTHARRFCIDPSIACELNLRKPSRVEGINSGGLQIAGSSLFEALRYVRRFSFGLRLRRVALDADVSEPGAAREQAAQLCRQNTGVPHPLFARSLGYLNASPRYTPLRSRSRDCYSIPILSSTGSPALPVLAVLGPRRYSGRVMYDDESVRLLKEKGFEIGASCIREGQILVRINNVFMFPMDADDLAHDRATIKRIIERNAGKVFPDAQ